MHVYLIQTPLQSQSACKRHPGGGGVLHLVSEPGYQTGQKFLKPSENYLKNRLQRSIFQEKFLNAIPQKPLALSLVSSF